MLEEHILCTVHVTCLLAVVCRGLQARETDASPLQDPALYPSWQPDPLLVAASPQRFAKLDMSATLLTNCQVSGGGTASQRVVETNQGSAMLSVGPTTQAGCAIMVKLSWGDAAAPPSQACYQTSTTLVHPCSPRLSMAVLWHCSPHSSHFEPTLGPPTRAPALGLMLG